MTTPSEDDALRIGTRERELAAGLLHEAVAAGYLDLGEFDERSRIIYAAKTRGELRAALVDLPTAAAFLAPVADPTVVNQGTVNIEWDTVKRRGDWQVPSHLVVEGSMGSADLDFSQAQLAVGGVIVEVNASWSSVKLRVGHDVTVRTEEFNGGKMSSVKDKSGQPSTVGGPQLILRGHGSVTTVVIKRG